LTKLCHFLPHTKCLRWICSRLCHSQSAGSQAEVAPSLYSPLGMLSYMGRDYEKPLRTWHKHSCAQWCTGWVWHGPSPRREQEAKCSTAVFPKLCSENSGFSCYNVIPSQRTVALTSCLPLDIKYLLKEDERFFWWEILIGWLWAAYEALLTLLLLSYAQIRENMGEWKCEHW
jgi:hypothetical protein